MNQDKNVLVIERIFDAPISTVWKYWSEPEFVKKWWGPKIFTCPVAIIDFRVGGKTLNCMRGKMTPDGPEQDFWSTGTYKEIVPMEKIVVTDSFSDKDGNIVPAETYGIKGFPLELEVTILFEDLDGKTKMTLRHAGIEHAEEVMRQNMEQGWSESFDKLGACFA